jgi:peptide/nickel transport system permease protein
MARIQEQALDSSIPASEPMARPVRQRVRSAALSTQTMHRLKRSKTALFGLGMVLVLVLVAACADVLAPYSPILNDPTATFQPPSRQHLLGTDQFGRDMLSRIIHGSRVSLAVGLSSVLLAVFIGVPLGLVAGFYGARSTPSSCAPWT